MEIKQILGILFNLQKEDEKSENKTARMSMPELLQALYRQMKQAEDNVTLAMAQVGLKRKELASLLQDRESLERQAEIHESAGRASHARTILSQMLILDKRIRECSEQVTTQDANAQHEIINFRDLEQQYQKLKSQVVETERLKPFNAMISRTNDAVGQFDAAVREEIQSRLNQAQLTAAQGVARIALRSGDLKQQAVLQEGRKILEAEHLDQLYLTLQERIRQKKEGVLPDETIKISLENPTDQARKLLEDPAFGGLIEVDGK